MASFGFSGVPFSPRRLFIYLLVCYVCARRRIEATSNAYWQALGLGRRIVPASTQFQCLLGAILLYISLGALVICATAQPTPWCVLCWPNAAAVATAPTRQIALPKFIYSTLGCMQIEPYIGSNWSILKIVLCSWLAERRTTYHNTYADGTCAQCESDTWR